MAELSPRLVVECVFLFVAFFAAYMFALSIPAALRKRGILSGAPDSRFWPMMLLRVACAGFFLWWIYFVPESNLAPSFGRGPTPSTGKGPACVALFVVAIDTTWATVRWLFRIYKQRTQ